MLSKLNQLSKSSDETPPNFQGHYKPTSDEIAEIEKGVKEIEQGLYHIR